MDWQYLEKKSHKAKLDLPLTGNYLHSIYIVLGNKYYRDDLKYTGGCV